MCGLKQYTRNAMLPKLFLCWAQCMMKMLLVVWVMTLVWVIFLSFPLIFLYDSSKDKKSIPSKAHDQKREEQWVVVDNQGWMLRLLTMMWWNNLMNGDNFSERKKCIRRHSTNPQIHKFLFCGFVDLWTWFWECSIIVDKPQQLYGSIVEEKKQLLWSVENMRIFKRPILTLPVAQTQIFFVIFFDSLDLCSGLGFLVLILPQAQT